MAFTQDVTRLEKSRTAKFTLAGVVAAKTPESGKRTYDSIQKICEVIMNAYEVANDSNADRSAKVSAIQAVCDLTSQLDWLLEFVKEETEWCVFGDENPALPPDPPSLDIIFDFFFTSA